MTQRTGAMAGEVVGAPLAAPDAKPRTAGIAEVPAQRVAEAASLSGGDIASLGVAEAEITCSAVVEAATTTDADATTDADTAIDAGADADLALLSGDGGTISDTASATTTATGVPSRGPALAAWLRPRAATLFPLGEAAVPARGRRWLAVVGAAGLIVGLTVTSLARQKTGVSASDSIWAEDGQTFYQQSVQYGLLGTVMRPYNGYLHLVPRILMELVRVFPLNDAAAAIAATGAVATSAMALLVYIASGTHLASRALRVSVAAPLALTWVAQLELGNNLLSLHIYLLYVAFWLCLWNPRSRSALVLAAVVLGLTAASDPLAGIYLPLLLLRAWSLRGRRRWIPLAGLGTGLLIQALAVVFEKALGTRQPATHYDPVWAAHGYSDFVVGSLFSRTPTGDLPYIAGPSGWPVVLGWLALAAAVGCAWLRWSRPEWRLAGLAFVHSVALFGVLAMKGGSLTPRYVLPALGLLLAAMASLVRPKRPAAGRRSLGAAVPAWGLLAVVGLAVYHGYSAGTWGRSEGPSWGLAVQQAVAACQQPGATEGDVRITTGPIKVPCSLVAHRARFFELGTG